MQFTIEVNNRKITAEKGETILSALNRNGILIPTLCSMKDFTPTGACRICVVEVEGRESLVTACSQPVEEWMKIRTHSRRVIMARKTIVELLLSNHPDDCLYCDRNLNCELQRLAEEMNITERRIRGKKVKLRLDQSSPAIVRELSKCILCGRCVRVCEEVVTVTALDFVSRGRNTHVGTSLDKDFNISSCINCGQCLLVCPTGALHEKHSTAGVLESLGRNDLTKVIQYSPVVPYALSELLGVRYSRDFDRVVNSILRKMGFDLVFNAGFAADIYIHELASVLAKRTGKDSDNPIYLSACPAWIKYAEQYAPGILPEISTLKPPQQIAGALIKSFIAENMDVNPENIYCLSVTPCIAMKYEADRDGNVHKGISEVDNVVTVMELARLIRLFGIDIDTVSGDNADEPMSMRSSAALLTEVSGGCTEAVGRSLHYINGDRDPGRAFFRKARSGQGFREIQLESGGKNYTFAVVDGLANMKKLNAKISEGRKYDLIEIMVCPGGCINGGGLSFSSSKEIIRNRARMVYQAEESEAVPVPLKSPALVSFFKEMEGKGRDNEYVALLHTKYNQRNVLL